MLTCTFNGWIILWTKGRIPSKRPSPTFLRNLCLRGGGGGSAYKVLYSTFGGGYMFCSHLSLVFCWCVSTPLACWRVWWVVHECECVCLCLCILCVCVLCVSVCVCDVYCSDGDPVEFHLLPNCVYTCYVCDLYSVFFLGWKEVQMWVFPLRGFCGDLLSLVFVMFVVTLTVSSLVFVMLVVMLTVSSHALKYCKDSPLYSCNQDKHNFLSVHVS